MIDPAEWGVRGVVTDGGTLFVRNSGEDVCLSIGALDGLVVYFLNHGIPLEEAPVEEKQLSKRAGRASDAVP